MTYVMSDLHGEYMKYRKMLSLIGFSDEDTLFIAGDICDRGKDSAKIYLDVMKRKNVIAITGNHELMAQKCLEKILPAHQGDKVDMAQLADEYDNLSWFSNGGDATVESLYKCSHEERLRILGFIKDMPRYATADVNGKHYIIVHGGYKHPIKDINPDGITLSELAWSRPYFDGEYYNDKNTYLIVGHTPTFLLRQRREPARIYHGKGDVIDVDCGAAYPTELGRLGCLCLDTGEEFYI